MILLTSPTLDNAVASPAGPSGFVARVSPYSMDSIVVSEVAYAYDSVASGMDWARFASIESLLLGYLDIAVASVVMMPSPVVVGFGLRPVI